VSQYRLFSPAGQAVENGEADVSVAGGALVVAPVLGAVLRVPFAQIVSVTEPEPFVVRVDCADGSAIELNRLGVMRTQLLAELRDGRAECAAALAGAVGAAETFTAWCLDVAVQVRVYEDAFLVDAERIGFSFVTDVQVKDYVVTVPVAGREPVTLTRLGRQTTELAGLLTQRLSEARARTASFLGSLLPGLGPFEARSAAAALRDGVAVPGRTLDAIHPALAGTLRGIATLPDRSGAVGLLAERTELAIGFKQVASVRRPATGTSPWHGHAASPHIGSHDSPGGAFPPGAAGMLAAGMMSDIGASLGSGFGAGTGLEPGGFGFTDGLDGFGEYWAFRALGAGMNGFGLGGADLGGAGLSGAGLSGAGLSGAGLSGAGLSGQQRPMATRPDMARGLLTPATDDPSALTVGGAEPTVLAFALCAVPGRVIYEVLNHPEPDSYVFVADDLGGLSTLNRTLDEAGFRAQALGRSRCDRIAHDEHWHDRIMSLLPA
jgi:hypothetical protein